MHVQPGILRSHGAGPGGQQPDKSPDIDMSCDAGISIEPDISIGLIVVVASPATGSRATDAATTTAIMVRAMFMNLIL